LGTPPIRTPLRNAAKWRFLALFGAFWEGFVADLDSQKQLMTIAQLHLYHRRKRGKSGRGSQRCDLPNRDGIDDRRTGAVRGALAPFTTLAERPGAAVVLMSHATSVVFKAGKHRRLFEEPDHPRPVPDQRGRDQRRLWRRSENGIGDLASAQSPVDRVQRWQR
jgi:hypothetical protein